MKTIAVIPAGGVGKRLKAKKAKQYLLVNDVPVLVHTLKAFQRAKVIDEIILVLPPNDVLSAHQQLINKYNLRETALLPLTINVMW
jgi:2-C-methyl-D-erythritol 4-phosphate cytidylyltransferase